MRKSTHIKATSSSLNATLCPISDIGATILDNTNCADVHVVRGGQQCVCLLIIHGDYKLHREHGLLYDLVLVTIWWFNLHHSTKKSMMFLAMQRTLM